MKNRMLDGELYRVDEALVQELMRARRRVRLFNDTREDQMEYRRELLKELLGATGEQIYIEPTFRCDYGSNIRVGENFLPILTV